MRNFARVLREDPVLIVAVGSLIALSVIVLRSAAPSIFPTYFLFILLSILGFWIFLQIDFDILLVFSGHFYVLSIFLLFLPLIIGQVTRGAIRWIPIGELTIQPSEIVRPFLLLFFAKYLTKEELSIRRLFKALVLLSLPFILILIQPSLGVAILTAAGFLGILLSSPVNKKYILYGLGVFILSIPVLWFALAPYQKLRITAFLDPSNDPFGAGYNSIQSMISVGSGRFFGRGLGEGVQTQLAFLPEKHTDFVFAATAEELGLIGAGFLMLGLFVVFWSLIRIVENAQGPTARAFVVGLFFILFAETFIHIGMNMGLLPITGVPLPFVSAGGSALLGTSMAIAISVKAKK
jgi:rod shape determining protein RodA